MHCSRMIRAQQTTTTTRQAAGRKGANMIERLIEYIRGRYEVFELLGDKTDPADAAATHELKAILDKYEELKER